MQDVSPSQLDGVPTFPPARILDLFAASGQQTPLPGGRGRSVRVGDLVLAPGRDERITSWLAPVLARTSVRMAERPGRRRRDLRVAVPVPTRDGQWVVDGWSACAFEPDAVPCRDLAVLTASAHLFHAELALSTPARPGVLTGRDDRWALAERLAFDARDAQVIAAAQSGPLEDLVLSLVEAREEADLGTDQLVHADLAGNVLLDAEGAPVVIDMAPCWRPVLWASAVIVLDSVLWHGTDAGAMAAWATGLPRQAMVRAGLFRALSDEDCRVSAYTEALRPLLPA